MDNKYLFKNTPPFLWINLDRSPDRKKYMEDMFEKNGITNHIRIPGFDGKNNTDFFVKCPHETYTYFKNTEYAVTCSHLKALDYFVNNIDSDICFICEDDLSFDYCKYWKHDINEYINKAPKDFNILQFCIILDKSIHYNNNNINTTNYVKHIPRRYWSAACYLIKKQTAIDILNNGKIKFINNKYDFSYNEPNMIYSYYVADYYIFNKKYNIYSLPIISHKNIKSTIQNDEIQEIHINSKNIIDNIWYSYENLFKNTPPFLWINLDRSPDRKKYMEDMFEKNGITNHIRIPGFDGKNNTDFFVKCPHETYTYFKNTEYAVTCSHLKALDYFVNNIDSDICFICEDDLSFDYCKYWKHDINEYINKAPKDFNILQLCIILNIDNIKYININNFVNIRVGLFWSTGCYLIKKQTAINILNNVKITDNKFDFLYAKNNIDILADWYIYNIKNTYTLPLFSYKIYPTLVGNSENKSNNLITESHIKSKKNIQYLWNNNL